jgi:uncharacterized protein YbjT (DUF2867 family)
MVFEHHPGTIGQSLVPNLCRILSDPKYTSTADEGSEPSVVRVLTRDASKAASLFQTTVNVQANGTFSSSSPLPYYAAKVEYVEGSVEDLDSLAPLLSSATRVFLLTLTSLGSRQRVVEENILSLLGLCSITTTENSNK